MKRILIVLLLLLAPTVYASDYHWEFAGWNGGGCFPNLTFDSKNKDRVYLTSDVAGIWRSDDLGEHWHFITKGLSQLMVSQVAIAPSDSNVLYAATKIGIFISHDAGNSWEAVDNANKRISFVRPQNYRPIAIDPQDSNKLCVGTEKGGIFCSSNGGGQWQSIGQLDPKPIAAISFDGSNQLVVASSNGLSRCSLNGRCNAIAGGPSQITDFAYSTKSPKTLYVAGDKKMWISNDDGSSWSQSQSIPEGASFRIALDESKDKPMVWVLWNDGWKGGVLQSTDEGQNWQEDFKNFGQLIDPTYQWASKNGKSTSLNVDPFNPQVIFETDWWGVWKSDDGGQSWRESDVGAPNTVATQVFISSNGDIYVASMDNGLLKSSDGGQTYQPLFPRKGYNDEIQGHVWRVFVDKQGKIIATSSPWAKQFNQVILSYDGGNSFNLVRSGLPSVGVYGNTVWAKGYPRALVIDPQNQDTIYLGIDGDKGGGLFVSHDGGASWARSAGQPGSLRIYHGLAIDPTNSNRIVWGAAGGGVYISNDKGLTFQNVFKDMSYVFNVIIGPDGTIYAGGDKKGPTLYVSNADKNSFSLLKHFDDVVGNAIDGMAINPQDSKMIAASSVSWSGESPCKLYLSRDAGQSWETINGDLPDGAGASSMTFDPKGEYLYISRYAGSVYKMKL